MENSKIKPLFLGNQEPQKSLCNRDISPVLRSLDSRFPGNDGISEHALVHGDQQYPGSRQPVTDRHKVRGNFATQDLIERCPKMAKAATNLVSAF